MLVISWVSGLVVVWGSWYRVGVESICSVYGVLIVCILGGSVDLDGLIDRVIVPRTTADRGPHRLVVRTSRRGRDNPGSTPGEDIFILSDSLLSFTLLELVARRTAAGKLHAGAIQERNYSPEFGAPH